MCIRDRILSGGLPSLTRQGMASIATIVLNTTAHPFGDAAIAAMAIVNRLVYFVNSAVIGFGQGFQLSLIHICLPPYQLSHNTSRKITQ